ncbi:hypothetical protein LR48_Vigan01g206500 [Vigna angularis]|uniref:Uncharacterized protein n=1 Tax=Phaseolus angularis TaxID=3914 RepID=A0A0L9TQT4_PHAAN|nr:hypothetical protein LR48_Vigan01g206500 [Vigna angularis]
MDQLSAISEDLTEIEGHIADNFRVLSNVFQKLKKIKDSNRQSRLTKEFDKEVKALENNFDRETNKMLNEKKQSMFKELNSYVALKKKHATNIDHKRIELFEGPNEGFGDEDQQMADAPDIAKPSAPAPASSSYSLESIFRQLSEMCDLGVMLCFSFENLVLAKARTFIGV